MRFDEEMSCPKCEKADVDTAIFAYKALVSRNAGKKLFLESPVRKKTSTITEKQRAKFIDRLTPPKEPKISLPAGAITIMALAVSWLATGSLIIGRIGQRAYFIISIIITIAMAIFFNYMLKMVIQIYRKRTNEYRRLKTIYNKKYFCNNCHYIFTLKE